MAGDVFPDNCVLINFAEVHRLDVLKAHLQGRGRWTQAIAAEVEESAKHSRPDLFGIAADGWLGEPIVIDDAADIQAVEKIRRDAFGGSAGHPKQHLGEAQTLWVILNRDEFKGAVWVTDDNDAFEFAVGKRIEAKRTDGVLRDIVADATLTAEAAFDLAVAMSERNRPVRPPKSPEDLE